MGWDASIGPFYAALRTGQSFLRKCAEKKPRSATGIECSATLAAHLPTGMTQLVLHAQCRCTGQYQMAIDPVLTGRLAKVNGKHGPVWCAPCDTHKASALSRPGKLHPVFCQIEFNQQNICLCITVHLFPAYFHMVAE